MDLLPEHYQIFAEAMEYSNGDAYDRTGSIFIIPATQPMNMVRALIDSIGVLPTSPTRKAVTTKASSRPTTTRPWLS